MLEILITYVFFLSIYLFLAIFVARWLKATSQQYPEIVEQYPEIVEQNIAASLTPEEVAFIVRQLDSKWDGAERRNAERRGK